jgi:hypothetical protein
MLLVRGARQRVDAASPRPSEMPRNKGDRASVAGCAFPRPLDFPQRVRETVRRTRLSMPIRNARTGNRPGSARAATYHPLADDP